MLLTEHLSNPSYPLRRLCKQDVGGLIESNAGKVDAWPRPAVARRPMLRQLKPDEVDEMVRLYEADLNLTPTQLAARFGVHRTTVSANLRRRGVTIRARVPAMSARDIEEAAALYRAGWSLSKLGTKYGISDRTVGIKLKQAGVVLRPPTGG